MEAPPPREASVRPASPGDAPAVLRLWGIARSEAATTTDDAPAIERLLAHDPGALLVAHFDERLVGSAIAAWDGWRGHIYRLAVLPEHRLQGVGRRLVAAGHERLRALGATRVNAAVGEHDPGPIAFWIAIGYHRDTGMYRFAQDL
jgi:ribosomal protein S18 acetylase RimI-like enzyme